MLGPNEPGLPAYVNLPRQLGLGKAAYLGASYNPFAPDDDPNSDGFQVRNLKLPGRVASDRLATAAKSCSAQIDQIRRDMDIKGDIDGHRHVLSRRAGNGHQRQGPEGVSHPERRSASSAKSTAATIWAKAACSPGGWSRRA